MPRNPPPVAERALSRITRSEEGCWIWPGWKNTGGYGVIKRGDGLIAMVHRVVYEALVGEIPDGNHLHHLCHTKACVNPAHLEPLSKRDHESLHAPLSDVKVREIRSGYLDLPRHPSGRVKHGERGRFAASHGVPEFTVKDILAGRRYADVV